MKKNVVMYKVYSDRFATVFKSTDMTPKKLAACEEVTFSETTIRRSIKNGKMNVELLDQIAKAIGISSVELYSIVCFKSKHAFQTAVGKAVKEYLEKEGAK